MHLKVKISILDTLSGYAAKVQKDIEKLAMFSVKSTSSQKGMDVPTKNQKEWKIKCLHCYSPPSNDKVYAAVIDDLGNNHYRVSGYYGKRTKAKLTMDPKDTHTSLDAAERQWQSIVMEKQGKGYLDISDFTYNSKVPAGSRTTVSEMFSKIDTTRLVGYADFAPAATALPVASAPAKSKVPTRAPKQEQKTQRSIKL